MTPLENYLKRGHILGEYRKEYRKQCEEISELFKEVKHITQGFIAQGTIDVVDEGRVIRALKEGIEAMDEGYADF